jgi:hypothetical protein
MKLKELQDKIDRRVKAKNTLDHIREQYDALQKAIQKYGVNVTLEYVLFVTPVERISFEMSKMPSIAAKTMLKSIGESIDATRHYIKMIDEDLKGIVEFEDEKENIEE